jgi:hypothetical protein
VTGNDRSAKPQDTARIIPDRESRTINNREGRPLEIYRALYEKLDPPEVAERCGVAYDPETGSFELNFMGNRHAVSYPEFSIRTVVKNVPADRLAEPGPAHILVIRYLIEGRLMPATGKYLTYREVPWGSVYEPNFSGRCIKRLAYSYGNSRGLFSKIMEAMKARAIKGGDVAYELEFMDGLFIRYLLWEGDDEFPPSAQILFSDNFPGAFTAEDLAVVGDVTIDAMKETAKLIGATGGSYDRKG